MKRIASGVILGAVFFSIVWYGSSTILLLVAIAVCILAFQEYDDLMRRVGADGSRYPALLATIAALAIVPFPFVAGEAVVGVGFMTVAIAEMIRLRPATHGMVAPPQGLRQAISNTAVGTLSIVYLGLPLGALVGIHIFGGRSAVVLLVATIVVSDTAQYYTGRLLGRRPLAPRLSPKKTIEGAIGGFVAAPLFLYFAGPYLVPVAAPWTIAALGVALVTAGIAGDLFESTLKRAAEMKDSSSLIPGHGGVLDRIDALLFATPVFYMYLRSVYTA